MKFEDRKLYGNEVLIKKEISTYVYTISLSL